jgi:hypothetical protein
MIFSDTFCRLGNNLNCLVFKCCEGNSCGGRVEDGSVETALYRVLRTWPFGTLFDDVDAGGENEAGLFAVENPLSIEITIR